MKSLKEIIKNIMIYSFSGSSNKEISSIEYDSRKCKENSLFIAISGTAVDGHNFITPALENGAKTIICEKDIVIPEKYNNITIIKVDDTRKVLARISHTWYDEPTNDMKVIGVTGTNGKTTITFLLKHLFEAAGEKCGIIGTTGIYFNNEMLEASHTTPESLELCSYLARMKEAGVTCVIMEVSSHALHQHRADFIKFNAALFTNLTHEHLDYHKTMEQYAAAKKILFDMLPEDSIALVHDISEFSEFLLSDCRSAHKYLIGRNTDSDIIIENEELNINYSKFDLDFKDEKLNLKTKLPGRFNVENAALSAALVYLMKIDKQIIIDALAAADGAPGRMQKIFLKNGAIGIVDYAHSPDALEKALNACRMLLDSSNNKNNRLICVFGCGGDRDKTKRPEMAEISLRLADFTIITNDNPRTENPNDIFKDILTGIPTGSNHKYIVISDRSTALVHAAGLAKENDIVLVAGKGHENYQIIGKVKHHFDDVEVLRSF